MDQQSTGSGASAGIRVAELVAALSLATDLGTGVPQQRALRMCLLGVRMGELVGLDQLGLSQTYYMTQLAMLGCTADSAIIADIVGDELALGARMGPIIFGPRREMLSWIVRHVGGEQRPIQRAQAVGRLLAFGMSGQMNEGNIAHCEVACRLADRLNLGEAVIDALGYTFERWDGAGARRVKGEAIPLPVRIGHLAWDLEVAERLGGLDACLDLVQRHAGAGLDPDLVERFCRAAPEAAAKG